MVDSKNNSGFGNSGDYNSGNYNSGNYNSGDYNSGNRNSGFGNSGNRNSGFGNSGDYNSGDYNSGDYNSGDYNSGDYNSGDYNSGDYNSGNRNSGNRNSGDYNSGDYNSGAFNTDEPTARLFNKDSGRKWSEIVIPVVDLKTTEWISDSAMSDEEKKNNPNFYITKGYLKKRDYKEAWQLAWSEMAVETKQQFLDLPNFDPQIFKEITGVDVGSKKEPTCEGKIVEIDGKKYKLTEV